MLPEPCPGDNAVQEETTVALPRVRLVLTGSESAGLELFDPEPPSPSGALPTFFEPVRQSRGTDRSSIDELSEHSRLGDFELEHELGRGSLARVFLARQISLDRRVALKVSTFPGGTRTDQADGEARTLASLEHDHIVRVFSQTVDREHGMRLLCMQHVPGTTLDEVIRHLGRRECGARSGRDILDIVAAQTRHGGDTTSLQQDRQLLERFDFVEAVCWLGARLAEALAYAHGRGVLHRDVKPANILIHRDGRPLLSDFNLALDRRRTPSAAGGMFGGTLRYMAPEHLDAFNRDSTPEAVDERSDLYSLGLVLHELLTGRYPFPVVPADISTGDSLRRLAAERRAGACSPRSQNHHIPEALDRLLLRCLEPEPAQRYQSAAELAQVLAGCHDLRRVHNSMPSPGPLTRASRRHPQMMALVLPLLPHLLGALVCFFYTALWVAGHPHQQKLENVFGLLALGYSVVVFPLTGTLAYLLLRPIWRTLLRLRSSSVVNTAEVIAMRRRALIKPFWGLVLSILGWLPGATVLPLLLVHLVPEAADWDVCLQYTLSFTIAGLIALTYTEFADQFLVLCIAYPALWLDPSRPRQTARIELARVARRLGVFQILSALIPLATGVALMLGLIGATPERRASPSYQTFLILVTVLMVLGMAGSWLAVLISSRLQQTLNALTGGREPAGDGRRLDAAQI